MVRKNTKKDGTKYNLYTDGLKIYTTLDSRMQQYAEDAVTEHLKELQGYFFKEKKGQESSLHLPSDPGAGGRDSGTCHEVVRPLPHYEESRSHRS